MHWRLTFFTPPEHQARLALILGRLTTRLPADWHMRDLHLVAGRAYAHSFISRAPFDNIYPACRAAINDQPIDVLVQPDPAPPIKLLMADMDATIIAQETLDDIACYLGVGSKVAEITQRAMAGELDFLGALQARLDLIKNAPASILEKVWDDVEYNPGAIELIAAAKQAGIKTVLVSGGFTYFTDRVRDALGFDAAHGNHLDIADGKITGHCAPPFISRKAKGEILQHYINEMGIRRENVLAIGDGANDGDMLQLAGLGIAYRGKPKLKELTPHHFNFADLNQLTALFHHHETPPMPY